MVGRVLVALLVAASAGFVMLQQRASETTAITSELADERARSLARLVDQHERAIAELTAAIEEAQAKVAWQEHQLAELAQDCTPGDVPRADVTIAAFQRRAPGGDTMGPRALEANGRTDRRYALVLKGDAASITRVRIYPGLDDGTPLAHSMSCDTLDGDGVALLGVVAGGRRHVGGFGVQNIAKVAGAATWELRCDENPERATPLVVEVVVAGVGALRQVLPPLPPLDLGAKEAPPLDRSLKGDEVARVIRQASSAIEACVAAGKGNVPAGKQRLQLTVIPSGVVVDARFADQRANELPAGRCILLTAKRLHFPAFVGEQTNIDIPLILSSP